MLPKPEGTIGIEAMRFHTSRTWPDIISRLASLIPAALHARRVALLLDDDQADLLTASSILEQCGCLLLRIQGPQQAIELFDRYGDSIDILITDLNILEKFGSELAEGLRQSCPDLPILVMCEKSRSESPQENCYLIEKRFTVWGLIESVAGALNAPDLIQRARLQLAH